MARNRVPEMLCVECDRPAGWLCLECLYEANEPGTWFLCEEHVKDHPHDQYGEPIPLVNSPRLGMCGYDGPAAVNRGEQQVADILVELRE